MDVLMAKLTLNTNLCLIRSAKDAVIFYDKICRTCLGTKNVVSMFNITYENLKFIDLLEQHVSIQVQEHDALPSQICNSCITDLINLHMFKKKCLQTQVTLEEIIKYSEARNAGIMGQSYNLIQVPFVYQEFLTSQENSQIKEKVQKASLSKIIKNNNQNQSNNKTNSDKIISVNDCTNIQMEVTMKNACNPLKLECINESNEWSQRICFEEDNNNIAEAIKNKLNFNKVSETINVKELETDNNVDPSMRRNEIQVQEKRLARKLICNICKERFDSIECLKQHRKDAKHYRVRRTTCHICGKMVGGHLSSHLRTHTLEKPYKCNICDKAFSLGNNLRRHIKSHSGAKHFMCEICGKGYTRQDTLKEHKVIHSGEFPFICNYCGETFNNVMKHRSHIRRHKIKNGKFGGVLSKISEEDASKLEKYTCEVCYKIYSSRASLYAHKFVHGEKKFSCNVCGKKFHTRVVLYNHHRIHTGEKPYTCKECGKSFSLVSYLKTHMLVHTGEKPYSCKTCSKSFKQRGHLKYHMRTHSGEKPYECDFCGKCFALKSNLIVHIRTHTGETPHVCEVCDRGFYDSSSLKKHKKTH